MRKPHVTASHGEGYSSEPAIVIHLYKYHVDRNNGSSSK
jgi:hypothetical protein